MLLKATQQHHQTMGVGRRTGSHLTRCLSTNGSSPGSFSLTAWPPLPRNKEEDSAFIPPPPPMTVGIPAWTDQRWASPLDLRRRIFCNRSLNMKSIRAVGFDMDYTIAQYKPEMFETLAHRLTIEKLVKVFGYPEVLYDLQFDWRYMMRGLTIDKKRGNVLKIDRHKYVKIAYHGFRELSREQRLGTYNEGGQRLSFEEPDFALIDTLFSLAEAFLFMQLVELRDADACLLPAGKEFPDLYRDVRAAVDLCHRDGSLKREVASDPAKYVHVDPRLESTLAMLRASGRKVFLATNSLWDYTHVVMNYLLGGKVGAAKNDEWLQHFDVVLTGCGKPAFFSQSRPLFEVHTPSGLLYNTEGGSPMLPIGEDDLPRPELASTAPDHAVVEGQRKARVFQGGNYVDLHKMLGVTSGAQVLYVGDHIYGDILRSKKSLGWRTMLVVPELETELRVLSRCKGNMQELLALRQMREAIDDQIQRLQWALSHRPPDDSADEDDIGKLLEAVDNLKMQRDEVRQKHRALLREHHGRFHPIWGQMLKTGYQNSQLAHQIERFACLYTSHVANLSFYSPDKSYRARMDAMAHDEEPWYELNSRSADIAAGAEGDIIAAAAQADVVTAAAAAAEGRGTCNGT